MHSLDVCRLPTFSASIINHPLTYILLDSCFTFLNKGETAFIGKYHLEIVDRHQPQGYFNDGFGF